MKNASMSLRLLSLLTLIVLTMVSATRAHASTNLLNVYVGASYGHANIRADDTNLLSIVGIPGARLGSLDFGHSAYQIAAGVRGLDVLGAEVDYFDLGSGGASPSWSGPGFVTGARASQKGEAAFAVLYLPVPVIDVYLKAGLARITTALSASAAGSTCPPGAECPLDLICIVGGPCGGTFAVNGAFETTETTFAAGAGVQWKFGDWAIRGEYERFTALGEHPDLASVGVTWSFL